MCASIYYIFNVIKRTSKNCQSNLRSRIYQTEIIYSLALDCDKLSCGVLRECLLMNNKPTCSVSTWKAAAVAVAGTVGAAVSVAAGVAAFKLLTRK